MFCAAVMGGGVGGGGAVSDRCLPQSMGLSCLALQTHATALPLKKSCSTVTQAAIVVVMEARDAAEETGALSFSSAMPSEARHIQRDGNSTFVQRVALFLVQAQNNRAPESMRLPRTLPVGRTRRWL